MTEKRFTEIVSTGVIIDTQTEKKYDCEYRVSDEFLETINCLAKENEQLKSENKRMINKLNKLALDFLNYNMVTMGKATEISEMSYHDFLKYRKENGNPMELQL